MFGTINNSAVDVRIFTSIARFKSVHNITVGCNSARFTLFIEYIIHIFTGM